VVQQGLCHSHVPMSLWMVHVLTAVCWYSQPGLDPGLSAAPVCRYGFFNNKRIVLFDTLIKECSEEEVVAVLAHGEQAAGVGSQCIRSRLGCRRQQPRLPLERSNCGCLTPHFAWTVHGAQHLMPKLGKS
jgi:hypothetical protein